MSERDQELELLLDAGRLAEAAALLERRGEPGRAAALYEQVWDFAAAARSARAAGDLLTALGHALRGRDQEFTRALIDEIGRRLPGLRRQAAEVCEQRGAWEPAARLFGQVDELARAATCLLQAGLELQAAAVLEEAGEHGRAAALYEQHLGLGAGTPAASNLEPQEAATALWRLGRLRLRTGQLEAAIPLLQQAASRDPATALPAGRAVVHALHQLGLYGAAHRALAELTQHCGDSAPTLQDCLDDPSLSAAGDAGGSALAGRYMLGELLGSGGMGRVYLARDLVHGQQVAIKVFSAPGGARGRDAYLRFVREARITGELQHPHIVSLLDFNESLGFMALELMAGGSLASRLRGPLPLSSCRGIGLQVVAGLEAAHQRGIVHRDLKPSNIFFTAAGAAKIGDFGVAHLQDAGQTQTGSFIGTIAYMSPEQIAGEPVSFATDFYALGVTLFQTFTGELPFAPPNLVQQHLEAPPPPPSARNPSLPAACDELVLRCMAKRAADRYGSLHELTRALERLPEGAATAALWQSQPVEQAPRRRSSDLRYREQAEVASTPQLQLLEALDEALGRKVILIRIAPGPDRPKLLARLEAAAAAGDQHLQRVLALDVGQGQAVLEAIRGQSPLAMPDLRRERLLSLCCCRHLGLALAPLHQAGLAHGAISPQAVSEIDGCFLLALTPALLSGGDPTPAADVAAVLEFCGLSADAPPPDGLALASWAQNQLDQARSKHEEQLRQALLEQALSDAPAGLTRRG